MTIRYKYAVPAENPPIPGLAEIREFVNCVSDDVTKDVRPLIAGFNPSKKASEILILDVVVESGLAPAAPDAACPCCGSQVPNQHLAMCEIGTMPTPPR